MCDVADVAETAIGCRWRRLEARARPRAETARVGVLETQESLWSAPGRLREVVSLRFDVRA